MISRRMHACMHATLQVRLAWHWSVEDFEETEPERFEFTGPLARGFYNDEGHFVDVADDEPHSETVPLIKKYTPSQRACKSATSWLLTSGTSQSTGQRRRG